MREAFRSGLLFPAFYQKGAILRCQSSLKQPVTVHWPNLSQLSPLPAGSFTSCCLIQGTVNQTAPLFHRKSIEWLRGNCAEKRMYTHLTEQVRLWDQRRKKNITTTDILFFFLLHHKFRILPTVRTKLKDHIYTPSVQLGLAAPEHQLFLLHPVYKNNKQMKTFTFAQTLTEIIKSVSLTLSPLSPDKPSIPGTPPSPC